ncbi:hypothetical protein [Vagococcus salmoninarum]|uniref:hypothetical protein n=1 Tax=Vagococcus salmoninarum TaxID=2739 RepID=UPI0028D8A3A8|nr:hypothetical protein [Vagococcus salmoninarum]
MKKKYLILISLIATSACTRTTGSQVTTAPLKTSTATSQSATTLTSETLTESLDESFPYQVNLEDFAQDITLDNGTKQTTYYLTFTTSQKNEHHQIVINTKDLNDEGHGIYLYSNDDQLFHPIRITTIPTKKLNLISDNGQLRQVNVNTAVTVMATDESDSSEFIGDTYYLFYNDLNKISLATRDFTNRSQSLNNDDVKMVEYLQASLTNSSESNYEQPANHLQSNDDIQSNNSSESKKSYFDLIYTAWRKQKDYRESIEDPEIKQSLQTTHSAAIMEATRLEIAYPEDVELIQASLQQVLAND